MIRQPAWERTLRQRLKGRARPRPGKSNLHFETVALVAMGSFMIAALSLAAGGDRGRMVAVTLITGALGALIGRSLRARWFDGALLSHFAPVDLREMRLLESRGAYAIALRLAVAGMVMAALGCLPGGAFSAIKALPVAVTAMATGTAFSSGGRGKLILWTSAIGAIAWSVFEVSRTGLGPGSIAHGFIHGWLPAFPWSLWSGGSSHIIVRLFVFSVALAIVFFEWRKAWRGPGLFQAWDPPPKEGGDDAPAAEAASSESSAEEEKDPRPELRTGLRATVTRGWVGLGAYVPFERFSKIDRLLWRSLVPNQRLLACLGTFGAFAWLRRIIVSSGLLASAVALVWTMRLSWQGRLGPAMFEYGILLGLPTLVLTAVAAARSGPGALSTFAPWVEPFRPGLQRAIPPLAIFPLSPVEWSRCARKEWYVRGPVVALVWSFAAVAVAPALLAEAGFRSLFAWFMTPWLWLASMLPFSVGSRLIRAYSGRLRGTHASGRVFLALFLMAISPAAVIVVVISFALRHLPGFAGGMAVAAIAGWVGLRLALAVCGDMRFDAAPAEAQDPQG
jgi:hypothetical protein